MKKYPIIEPIVVILLGVVVIAASYTIEVLVTSIQIGPDFMPRLLGICMVILGLCLVPEALKKQKALAASSQKEETVKPVEKLSFKAWCLKNMHLINWVLMLIYGLLMKPLGFLVDSILYLFAGMYLLTIRNEKRNWIVISIVAIVLPTLVYIIFRQKFYLMLPVGLCKYIPFRIFR